MKTNSNDFITGFNQTITDCDGNPIGETSHLGLTKREYFAAMALQGMLSNSYALQKHNEGFPVDSPAEAAVMAADQLIKALNAEADHAE